MRYSSNQGESMKNKYKQQMNWYNQYLFHNKGYKHSPPVHKHQIPNTDQSFAGSKIKAKGFFWGLQRDRIYYNLSKTFFFYSDLLPVKPLIYKFLSSSISRKEVQCMPSTCQERTHAVSHKN